MNRNSSKLRKKFNRRTKKKHTHRKNKNKNKNKNKANIILEQRFKNLNAKTVKALQKKFRKEHLLLKNKNIVNREQIGCSSKKKLNARQQIGCSSKRNISGGFVGGNLYNTLYGNTQHPGSASDNQPLLGDDDVQPFSF
jgi:hypothetical protein